MADTLSQAERSERMSLIKARDTKPEMLVRRVVYRMGYRYQLHRHDLPGRPDITFAGRKKIIFVHGCFWHRHADANCKLCRLPKSRIDFWLPKLQANADRDERSQTALAALGWKVLVIWECELNDLPSLQDRICSFLGS